MSEGLQKDEAAETFQSNPFVAFNEHVELFACLIEPF